MEKSIFTRQELYDLVWSEPLIRLSVKYMISDNGLRKICKRMNIPLPDRNHWLKVKHRNSLERKKLPTNYSGVSVVTLNLRDNQNLLKEIVNYRQKEILKSYNNIDRNVFKVPNVLKNPDILIKNVQKRITSKSAIKNVHNGLVSSHFNELDIKVSPENINRALCLFDALIKLLRYRSHDVKMIEGRTCAIFYNEINIRIGIVEKLRMEKVKDKNFSTYIFYPKGILCFKIWHHYDIKEIKESKIKLEDMMDVILSELEYYAEKEKNKRIENEKQQRLDEIRNKRESRLHILRVKEIEKFKNLLTQYNRWQQAKNMREFIEIFKANNSKEGLLSKEIEDWINWANQKVDWFDPLINKKDPLLGICKQEYLYDNGYNEETYKIF